MMPSVPYKGGAESSWIRVEPLKTVTSWWWATTPPKGARAWFWRVVSG